MILLVDDELNELDRIGGELMAYQYKVLIAHTADTALDLLVKNPVDLLIVDSDMPEKDGFNLIEQVRSNNKYRRLPVLLLDARGDNETIERGKQLDVLFHIPKPVKVPKLIETVTDVFKKSGEMLARTREIREHEILRSLSILIVDDEENIRSLLCEYLCEQVKCAVTASSADEAIEAVKSHAFNIVITDIKMKEKSGFDLVSWINLYPELAGAPVIMMTGVMKDVESVKRAKLLLIDRYLAKPFDLSTMKNMIVELGTKEYRYNKLVKFKWYIAEQEKIITHDEGEVLTVLREKIMDAKKEQTQIGRELFRISKGEHSKEAADITQKKESIDSFVEQLQDELIEQKRIFFEKRKIIVNLKRLNQQRTEFLKEE